MDMEGGLPVSTTGNPEDGGSTPPKEHCITKDFQLIGDYAAAYTRGGWRVFPLHTPLSSGCSCGTADCSKIGKHPRIADWQHAASSDPATVAAWWEQFPEANIGFLLDGMAVLDVDPRHGGFESLLALEEKYSRLERIARQESGSGGAHFLMAPGELKAPIARGFRPGLDLLTGTGCYIVVEPSRHASGGHYQWADKPHPLLTDRDSTVFPQLPRWLLDVAAVPTVVPNGGRKGFAIPDEIGEGRRDTTLASAAGKMRRAGFSPAEILAALRQMNQERCKPPMAQTDVERIAASIGKKQPAADEGGGLTNDLASAILAADSFARDQGTLLYRFEKGVYRPTAKRFIETRVKSLCVDREKTKSWNPELPARVEQWIRADAPELWERPPLDTLNCRNGLLDVESRTLRPHSPGFLSAIQIAAAFDPGAECPHIDRFIGEVFPDDCQHLSFEVAAWLMLPETSLQKAVLLLGSGANGKSAWLSLILSFLGRENVSALSLHRLEADKFTAARLVGKLVNIGSDLPSAALTGTSMFKALTGGDIVTAERKFEQSFEFTPFSRLLFSANSAPRAEDSTHGFFRRWLVVPFGRTFDESDPDTVPRAVLDAQLSEPGELSGLLNKALDALPAIRKGRFTESASTRAALADFRATTDPLAAFLDKWTVERPDGMVLKDVLRRAYGQVCQDSGRPLLMDVQFTAALQRLRPGVEAAKRTIDGKKTQVYLGLGMVTAQEHPSGLF
jgi:P4 family phage/plasmid primase-like protien